MKKPNKIPKMSIGKKLKDNVITNTFKSITSLTVTEISDAMPFLSQINGDTREIISEINSKANNITKESSKSLTKFLREEKIKPNLNKFIKNLKEDLKTGNWESRANNLEELGFDDLDEYDPDGSGEEGTFGKEDVSTGETFIAEANARAISRSTNNITNTINSTTEASIEVNKELTLKSMKFTGNILNNGFATLNTGISSLVTFSATVLNDHVNNSKNYYSTMMDNSSTIISLLTEIKESQSSSGYNKDSSENESIFRKIFGSGDSFNIKEAFKIYTEQAVTDFEALKDPIINSIKDVINNPMKSLGTNIIRKMSKRTTHILGEIDTGLNDLVTNVFTKIANNDIFSALTGVSIEPKRNISSSNYYKGDMKWNGYSQKSLMDVIPGYLSRIESFLTKQPEIIFDYEKGKWITKGTIDKEKKNIITQKGRSATSDLFDYLGQVIDFKKLSVKEKESFKKGIDELAYQMMNATLHGKNVFEEVSQNKILTSSSILNNSLIQVLKTDKEEYKMNNKLKNRIVAELTRASQDISDEFESIGKQVSSIFQHNGMDIDINDIIKLRERERDFINRSYQDNNIYKYNNDSKKYHRKDKKYSKSENIQNEAIEEARRIQNGYKNKYTDESIKSRIDSFKRKYSDIKKEDIYDKKGKIKDIDKFYFANNKTKSKVKNFIDKYNADNWYRFLKDYKDPELEYEEFLKLWNTDEEYRHAIAIDLLYRTGDIDIYSSLSDNKAEKMLDQTIKKFVDMNQYKVRTREEIIGNRKYVQNENNSLYGMNDKEFIKSKFKSTKDLRNERLSDMESYLRDATDLTISNIDKNGETSAWNTLKSTLSLPDKVIYGMFKKVDEYVFKTLFDDGRFFGDESYKGLIPTIKSEVVNQMKDFGKQLDKEVLQPLANNINSDEMKSTVSKFTKMLDIDGDIKKYRENILQYFNGRRDEDGNLLQIGLKHKVFDSIKKDSMSLYDLGKDTIKDIMSLGKKYDGGYAEGGIVGNNKTKDDRPDYDKVIGDYEPEKEALTEFISKILWNNGNIPAFAKGGRVVYNSNANKYKQRKGRSNLVTNPNYNYSPKMHNIATETEVIDGNNEGIVITAQSGEAVLTKEQTKSLIDKLKANIKNGTASKEDIELAKTLGIKYKISDIKDKTIGFLKNQTEKIKNKSNSSDPFRIVSNDEMRDILASGEDPLIDGMIDTMQNTDVFRNFKLTKKLVGSVSGKTQEELNEKILKSKMFIKDVSEEGKKYTSDIISGGAIGLGASFLTGGLLTPFLGLSLGAGMGLARKSSKVQEALFGGDGKDSILNQDIGKYIKEKLPKTTMGGILGSIGSTFLMGNPIPGLLLGSSLAHVAQNDELKMKLFGTGDPEKYMKRKDTLKKLLPSMSVGAVTMALTGPFGLVGNVLLGSAAGAGVGILGMSEKFQKAVFGEKGSDGKYYGGLLPTFREQVLEPLGDSLNNLMRDTKKWFKDAIYENLKKGLSPLKKLLTGTLKKGWGGTKKLFKKAKSMSGNSFVGRHLKRFGRKTHSAALKVGNGLAWAGRGLVGAPFKLFGTVGGELEKHFIQANGGVGAGEYTAQERYDLANKYNIDDGMYDITDILMDANYNNDLQQKLDLRDGLRYVNNIVDEDSRTIQRNKLIKSTSKKLKDFAVRIDKSGGWKDERKYVKLVKAGKLDEAFDLLNKTDLDEGIKIDLLNDLSPKIDDMKVLNSKDLSFDSTYDYLKSKNFSDEMIESMISSDENGNTLLNKKFNLDDKLAYVNKDIDKGSFKTGDIYNMTKNERSKLSTKANRFKSIDDLAQQMFDRGSKSDLSSLDDAIMNMHLSGKDIKLLLEDGKSPDKIKGYQQYKFLSDLGIDNELLDSFNEKDKISISKSLQSLISGIKEDTGFSKEFKDYLDSKRVTNLTDNESIKEYIEPQVPDQLVSIDDTVKKYLPMIAAGTGVVTDISTIEDDLKPKSRSTSSKDIDNPKSRQHRIRSRVNISRSTSSRKLASKVINDLEDTVSVNNSNLESNVYKLKNEDKDDDVRELDGKKQIKTKSGDWVYDKTDKGTREILKQEEEDRELKNSFFSKFASIDLSKLNPFKNKKEKDDKKPGILSGLSGLLGSIPSLIKKGLTIGLPFIIGNILTKLSGDSSGNPLLDISKNTNLGFMSRMQGIFGNDDISVDGRTSSDEDDKLAKQERTDAQNILNNTLGKFNGRDGYMGNADTIDGSRSVIGMKTARTAANIGDKIFFKAKNKGQNVVLKNMIKAPFTGIKSIGKSIFNKNDRIPLDSHIKLPEKSVEEVSDISKKSNTLIDKLKNTKFGSYISKGTDKISETFDNTKSKIGNFFNETSNTAITKFNSILDKFYESMNKVPDFNKVFSDSKFINQLTEFCSDKAILNKIPFDKIASGIGDIVNKLIKRVASVSDSLLKKGVSGINKFLAKTVGKGIKSEAKTIPYLGIALSVIDVIYGMVNYRDILGISSKADLDILQSLLYRIMGGVAYFLLNLPYIWVASLLLSEEIIVGFVLDLAEIILPNTEIAKLRKDAESEIDVINEKLKEQGKDSISTVTQLNEYYKREEKKNKRSKWNPLNWFKKEEDKENKNFEFLNAGKSIFSRINFNTRNTLNSNNAIYRGSIELPENHGIGGPAVDKNQLDFVGKYVKKFESGDSGSKSISSGKGDYGGVSYGTYQLASFSQDGGNIGGSAKAFWDTYYKNNYPDLKLVNNDKFKNAWLSEVDKDPNKFFNNEHDYIMNKYYKPVVEGTSNLNDFIKSRAMQESILSTSVQYGSGLAKGIFQNIIKGKDPDSISQYDLVSAVQDYKSKNVDNHFRKSSQSVRNSLKNNRIPEEKVLLQNLANMPIMDTSKITGDISTMSNNNQQYADPSSLDNEGNPSLSPGNSFMDFISDINTIMKTMVSGVLNKNVGNNTQENYNNSENNYGSPMAMQGITSADDHFGFKVTSKFGEQRGSQFHNGIDYGMPQGTEVKTPVSGKVEINKSNPNGYGEYVGVRDKNKMLHIFGHLSNRSIVKKGQEVSAGDIVGLSGNTGASTGPHLHYEVTNTLGSGRQAQDPNKYLAAISQAPKSAQGMDNENINKISTSGVGGPSVKKDDINILNESKVEEYLDKIVNLLTTSNINTSLIQSVVNILKSLSNGDISINNNNGKDVVKNLKNDIKKIKEDDLNNLGINSSSLFSQLESLVIQ